LKSKYYPPVLLLIFSLFFGPQFALVSGLGVGYLWVFGYLKCLETSTVAAREWEGRWPFSGYAQNPSFRGSSSSLANNPP